MVLVGVTLTASKFLSEGAEKVFTVFLAVSLPLLAGWVQQAIGGVAIPSWTPSN